MSHRTRTVWHTPLGEIIEEYDFENVPGGEGVKHNVLVSWGRTPEQTALARLLLGYPPNTEVKP